MKTTAALVAALVLASSIASAQTDMARAKDAYDRGVAAHARSDFKTAAREFAEADALAPSNVALQAALDAAVDADDPVIGGELLERSRRVPPGEKTKLLKSIEAARKKLGGRTGRVHVTCPTGATCTGTLDGTAFETRKHAWVTVGAHKVVVQVDGEPFAKAFEVKADDTVEIAPPARSVSPPTPAPLPVPVVAPTPLAPAAPAAPLAPEPATIPATSPSEIKPPTGGNAGLPPAVFWVGVGATVVSGGVATLFMLRTRAKHTDFVDGGCANGPAAGCDTLKTDGEDNQTKANVLLGVTAGLGVLVTVIGVAFTDWRGSSGNAALGNLTPIVGGARGTNGASYSLRF